MPSSGAKTLSLDAISIPSANKEQPAGLIVMLHTWGANAQTMAALVPQLSLPNYHFLLPNAPLLHPNVWGGRMWYDLETENYQGLRESKQQLTEWLNSLESSTGVPPSSTILAGFSQGGAMALDIGFNVPLAGIICMSGYLHRAPEDIEPPSPSVLIVHGKRDQVVPLSAAQRMRDYLITVGAPVQYKELDIGYEITPEVLEVVRDFILVNIY
ncbi:MAG: alpha/beta hydrolase [Coleofasciculaceae cyanobacterium]